MGRGRAIAPTGFTQNYSKRIGDESKDIDESNEKQGNPMEFRNPKKLEKSKDIDESDEKQGNPGSRRDQME